MSNRPKNYVDTVPEVLERAAIRVEAAIMYAVIHHGMQLVFRCKRRLVVLSGREKHLDEVQAARERDQAKAAQQEVEEIEAAEVQEEVEDQTRIYQPSELRSLLRSS